jgi:NAD(P)-dependent dehydrogenase (short-subunit alcohol dehydrogenase family)
MILDKYGKIDILVNNASWNDTVENRADSLKSMQFEYYPLELWNRSLAVNLTGTFLTSQIIGGAMVDRRSGSIINIASTYGMVAPDQKIYISPEGKRLIYKSPSYSATKGAVLSLTRFLASYWGQQGIRVNALSPGGVENGQEDFFVRNYSARTMLGRMAGPCDYEGAVVFLASDASAYMTGANLVVDGGWTAW